MIERRPKRKGKVKLLQTKYVSSSDKKLAKGRRPTAKYQKKLVVIVYMGPDAPQTSTLKENHVLLRGMLPEIAIDARERHVHTQIRDTIKKTGVSYWMFAE